MYQKKVVFLSACLGMLLFGITLITLGSILPELTLRFNLSPAQSGALLTILPIGILGGSLMFGPFCDKYGYKYLLILSAIIIGLGLQGVAFASSFLLLQVSIFFFGFAGGCINGATNALVADISDQSKGANLSLLGVFFGIGALGMPSILGFMESHANTHYIISAVGGFAILSGLIFMFVRFPLPKNINGFPIRRSLSLLKDRTLIIVALILFCQSSFEALVNNWTTTFLSDKAGINSSMALYALSLSIVGMTGMRLLMGSIMRNFTAQRVLIICFVLLGLGCSFLFAQNYTFLLAGMLFMGAGLAAGFPVMFAIVASKYEDLSATAISLVLVFAMVGNMLVNYLAGIVIDQYGAHSLHEMMILETILMAALCVLLFWHLKKRALKV